VRHPEVGLPAGVPLVGGEAVQPGRLGVVLRDSGAIRVHHSEVGLSGGVPLVGGEAVQSGTLGEVLGDPGAILVHRPEVDLRRWHVPARRSRDQACEPLDIDLVRDCKQFAAVDWVHDLTYCLCHVAVAAVLPAACEALAALAEIVLVLEADRARVSRVIVIVINIGSGRHCWAL